jgi:hypothetical protein
MGCFFHAKSEYPFFFKSEIFLGVCCPSEVKDVIVMLILQEKEEE